MFLKEKEKCINIEKIMSIMEINNDIYLNKNNYGVDVNKEDDDEWIKILEEDDDYSYWEGYIENKIIEGGYEEFVKAFDYNEDYWGLVCENNLLKDYYSYVDSILRERLIKWCEENSIRYVVKKLSKIEEKACSLYADKLFRKWQDKFFKEMEREEMKEYCKTKKGVSYYETLHNAIDSPKTFKQCLKKYKLNEEWEEFRYEYLEKKGREKDEIVSEEYRIANERLNEIRKKYNVIKELNRINPLV